MGVAAQCYKAAKAPTKDDLWQAYYTNAKLKRGYCTLTPLKVLEAVNAQTDLDPTRVYINKDNGEYCNVEIVAPPIEGMSINNGWNFGYIDLIQGVDFGSLNTDKTWYKVMHDPLYDGSEFISVSFNLWYDPPLRVKRGWING
jgi:hypothetical protein